LTIYTVVIGVMTLITGFRGMNVWLPGDGVGFMVRIILSLMILIGIVIARWARRKGWGL
jgi:Mg2+ and Co2+ transporter CorA